MSQSGLAMAYREGGMTMPVLAAATGWSVSLVSRLMEAFENIEATGKAPQKRKWINTAR